MHQTAREMFEAARDAAREAARCRRLIDAERERKHSLGGGGLGPRVIVSDPDTDCATGFCTCGACGGAIDPWDAWCRHCGARMEGE